MKVLVITNNYRNYSNWCRENRIKIGDKRYYFINKVDNLRGVYLDKSDKVIKLYDSSKVLEIDEILKYIESHTVSNYKGREKLEFNFYHSFNYSCNGLGIYYQFSNPNYFYINFYLLIWRCSISLKINR